ATRTKTRVKTFGKAEPVLLLNLPPIGHCCHGSSPCYLSPLCDAALARVAGAETRCVVFSPGSILARSRRQLIDKPLFQGRKWIWTSFSPAWISFSLGLEFLQPGLDFLQLGLEFVPGGLGGPTPARHPVQSRTILPQSPRRMVSKPSRNRLAGRRWVMTLRTLSPLSSMVIILCQVSNISRP